MREVVEVERQHGFGVQLLEVLVAARLPTVGEMRVDVGVFVEEAVLVRNSEMIEHGDNHAEVRDQNGLAELDGEIFFLAGEARKQLGADLAEHLLIELVDMETDPQAVKHLVSFELAQGDRTQLLVQVPLAEAHKYIGQRHFCQSSMGGVPTKAIAAGIDGTGSPEWRRRDGANSHVFRFITDVSGIGDGNIESGVRSATGSKKYFHGPNTAATDFGGIIEAAYLFVVSEMARLMETGCSQSEIKLCLVGHSRGCVGVVRIANILNAPTGGHAGLFLFGSLRSPVQVGYLGLYDTVNRSAESVDESVPNVVAGRHARRQNRGFLNGSRSTFGTVDFPRFPPFDVDTAHGGVGGDPGYFTSLGQITKDYYCNARQLIMTQDDLTRDYGMHASRMGVEPNYRPLTGSAAEDRRARLARSVRDVVRADDYVRTGAIAAGFSFGAPASTLLQYGEHDDALWQSMMSAIRS